MREKCSMLRTHPKNHRRCARRCAKPCMGVVRIYGRGVTADSLNLLVCRTRKPIGEGQHAENQLHVPRIDCRNASPSNNCCFQSPGNMQSLAACGPRIMGDPK